MSWEIFLGVSMLASVSWTLLQRVLMKGEDSDPIAFSIVSNLIAGLLATAFAVIRGFSLEHVGEVLPHLGLMALLYGLGNVLMFRSMKLVEASTFTILFTTRVLWSILAAILFLREVYTLQQFAGTILIFLGILLVTLKKNKLKLGRGEVYVLLCAVAFGLQFINDAAILQKIDVFLYIPLIFIIPQLLIWAVFPQSNKRIVALFTSPSMPKLALLGTLFSISATTYLLAYEVGQNAAQIASINQTQTIITVLAATILLKERTNYKKKIIASSLAFIGILLIR